MYVLFADNPYPWELSLYSGLCQFNRGSRGFPHSSVGKESTCNAGDPGLIPGWGRSAGEGTGYPLQYSWASLVAQLVKNPPAIWETWVQSLGWEDSLGKEKVMHSNILAWRIPWTIQFMGLRSQTRLSDFFWGSRLNFEWPGQLTCVSVHLWKHVTYIVSEKQLASLTSVSNLP